MENTGRHPVTVWKCVGCGLVSNDRWEGGSHMELHGSDEEDPEQRCTGEAGGPFYLLSQDEYLDVVLERNSA